MTAHVETVECQCGPKINAKTGVPMTIAGREVIFHRPFSVTGNVKRRKIGGLPEGYIVKGNTSAWTMTRKERDDELEANANADRINARRRRNR